MAPTVRWTCPALTSRCWDWACRPGQGSHAGLYGATSSLLTRRHVKYLVAWVGMQHAARLTETAVVPPTRLNTRNIATGVPWSDARPSEGEKGRKVGNSWSSSEKCTPSADTRTPMTEPLLRRRTRYHVHAC